jgi:uncharacterized lipoprotein NlpE involved in copper resistance
MRTALVLVVSLVGCDRQTNPLYCEAHPGDHTTGCPFIDAAPLPDAAYKDAKYTDAPPNFFRIAGTVTGLTGQGMVLQDNGTDDLPRTADGAFIFMTPLANGSTYAVTIKTQPSGQSCTLANATGTVMGADVTNVAVNCNSAGIGCGSDGSTYCDVGMECCTAGFTCKNNGPPCSGGVKIECDDTADCSGIDICCAAEDMNNHVTAVQCLLPINCQAPNQQVLCDPNIVGACSGGKTCQPVTDPVELAQLNYHSCQ